MTQTQEESTLLEIDRRPPRPPCRRLSVIAARPSVDGCTRVADRLQERLAGLSKSLATIEHLRWNVVGPRVVSVDQLLDLQQSGIEDMIDRLAARITALGGTPVGPGPVPHHHASSPDQPDRPRCAAHTWVALDLVYRDMIEAHRDAVGSTGVIDPVSDYLLIRQTATLERYGDAGPTCLADLVGCTANDDPGEGGGRGCSTWGLPRRAREAGVA